MFITVSSHPESGKRQYKCMLSGALFPFTTGNDASRNEAESACRSHQGAIVDGLFAANAIRVPYTFGELQAAYERSLA